MFLGRLGVWLIAIIIAFLPVILGVATTPRGLTSLFGTSNQVDTKLHETIAAQSLILSKFSGIRRFAWRSRDRDQLDPLTAALQANRDRITGLLAQIADIKQQFESMLAAARPR